MFFASEYRVPRKHSNWFNLVMFYNCIIVVQLLSHVQPHGLQHTRLPCPSPSPGVFSNSCLLRQWCYLTISCCRPFPLLLSIFPNIRVYFNGLALHRWPKYCSFSFCTSPSNEYLVKSFLCLWPEELVMCSLPCLMGLWMSSETGLGQIAKKECFCRKRNC